MARTYRRIAENGAQEFYTGDLSREIAADVAAQDGFLSADDLAEVAPTLGEPLWGTYRGLRIATNRPPGGGIMLIEMLNILENFDLAGMGHNSAQYIATVSEAMKIATTDKDTKIGDPNFVDVPVDELTSKDYAADAATRIKRGEKAHIVRMGPSGKEESKDTTHICAIDPDGNCVSLTHSIGMPSGVVSPGLGFMYNGCMGVFDPRPGRAGSLAPGKSRFTAMCPTILFDGDEPFLVIGAPGGTYITMGVSARDPERRRFRHDGAAGLCRAALLHDVGHDRPDKPHPAPHRGGIGRDGLSHTPCSFQLRVRWRSRSTPHGRRMGWRCRSGTGRHGDHGTAQFVANGTCQKM